MNLGRRKVGAAVVALALIAVLAFAGAETTVSGQSGSARGSLRPPAYTPQRTAPYGNLASPAWWNGACDGSSAGTYPSSRPIGSSWHGLTPCGPGPNEGGSDHVVRFFPGAWGEYEWECVELSMRWMYLAWGVPPYPANGNDIVDNYARYNPDGPKLRVVRNGTRSAAPQPGDVLEMVDGDPFGHTAVVTASRVNGRGNGTVLAMTENLNSPSNGHMLLTVHDWVVRASFGAVVDWLHNPGFSLEEPALAELDSSGTLSVKVDSLAGTYRQVRTGVVEAEVIGGAGTGPAPILVVLRTSGKLQAGYELPGAPLWTVASDVSQFAATSTEGPSGKPTIGWLTSTGDFYVRSGSLLAPPVLEATGARSITVGSDSSGASLLLGYVNGLAQAYVKVGSAPFARVAVGVSSFALSGTGSLDPSGARAVEAYIGLMGNIFVRRGTSSPFHEISADPSSPARQLALTVTGPRDMPVLAYLTASGQVYAKDWLGDRGWLHEMSSATAVALAGASGPYGFPVLAVRRSNGRWLVKQGTLSSGYVAQGSPVWLGVAALVVS